LLPQIGEAVYLMLELDKVLFHISNPKCSGKKMSLNEKGLRCFFAANKGCVADQPQKNVPPINCGATHHLRSGILASSQNGLYANRMLCAEKTLLRSDAHGRAACFTKANKFLHTHILIFIFDLSNAV
jgi:hypothetical protein